MKRRDFFKIVTGFVAGVVATVVPKVEGKKRSGTRYVSPSSSPTSTTMISTSSNYIHICNVSDLNDDTEEELVCVTPGAKRFIEWVRKEYPQFS